ncbi:membrane protein insertase YidC [Metamycoplasma canadense]|nr:membrane protein insertase YidC [Metamycoplasma canadense]
MAKKSSSKHYNSFRINQKPESKQPKSIWKKVWKWIKIILITLIISVGLVGCVQSFATKSGTKVGSGQEIYSKSSYISPNIATLRWNKEKNEFFVPNINKDSGVIVNSYLGLEDEKQIQALREQDAKNGGQYGIYGGSSFALQLQKQKDNNSTPRPNSKEDWKNISNINIQNEDGKRGVVYGNGKNHIYINFGDEKGQGKTKFYTPVNKINDIYLPLSIKFENYKKYTNVETDPNATPQYTFDAKTDYSHLKELKLAKVSLNSISESNIYNTLLADIFTTLVSETFKIWSQDTNNRSGFADLISTKNNISIEKLKNLDKNELIKEWNKFILSYKDLIGADKNLSEDEGKKLNKLFLSTSSMMKNYATMTSISQKNYTIFDKNLGKDINLFTFSPVNELGNYKPDAWKNRLLSADSFVAQKPISTYKEHWQQGPFYGLFVYPFSQFMNSIMRSLNTTGWSVVLALVITVVIVRIITFFLTAKTIFSAAKMEELNQKKAKIDAKYEAYRGDKQMQQRKQMEISELYKKEKISPLSQLINSFITLPILIVVFRIISTSPEIKQATLYSIQFSATSIFRIFKVGELQYLPIVILSVVIQIIAQFMPKILKLNKKKSLRADAYQRAAMKKSNKKAILIPIIFAIFGLFFSAGLQIYWIIGGIFTIVQHIIVHYIQKTKWYKNKLQPFLFKAD